MRILMRCCGCVALVAILAACGTKPSDRAISGAGIGATAGTVGAVLIDGNPLTGAALGAAAGAITGAATDSEDMNFGTPFWKQ